MVEKSNFGGVPSLWPLESCKPVGQVGHLPRGQGLRRREVSRLNSRAAAMIVTALHETVRQEVVARRLTGSTVRLVFRLLTLYQPGGEEEKFKILQNLQSTRGKQGCSRASSLEQMATTMQRAECTNARPQPAGPRTDKPREVCHGKECRFGIQDVTGEKHPADRQQPKL